MDFIFENIRYGLVSASLGLILPGFILVIDGRQLWKRIIGLLLFLIPILLAIFFYPPIFRDMGFFFDFSLEGRVSFHRFFLWLSVTLTISILALPLLLGDEKSGSIIEKFTFILGLVIYLIPTVIAGILSNLLGIAVNFWVENRFTPLPSPTMLSAAYQGMLVGVTIGLVSLLILFLIKRLKGEDIHDWEESPYRACCFLTTCIFFASLLGGVNASLNSGSILGGIVGFLAGGIVGIFVAGKFLLES